MPDLAESCAVIGIGNADRGDDAVGRVAARLFRASCAGGVDVCEIDGEATALLSRLEGAAAAYLIDACVSGAPPGTIRRFDAAEAPLPSVAFGLSSHGFGLAEALELARALGQLPKHCIVYAIEAGSFSAGAPLTPAVAQAAADVARRLAEEVAARSKAKGWPACTKPI